MKIGNRKGVGRADEGDGRRLTDEDAVALSAPGSLDP
jgi:hypothetical protein